MARWCRSRPRRWCRTRPRVAPRSAPGWAVAERAGRIAGPGSARSARRPGDRALAERHRARWRRRACARRRSKRRGGPALSAELAGSEHAGRLRGCAGRAGGGGCAAAAGLLEVAGRAGPAGAACLAAELARGVGPRACDGLDHEGGAPAATPGATAGGATRARLVGIPPAASSPRDSPPSSQPATSLQSNSRC